MRPCCRAICQSTNDSGTNSASAVATFTGAAIVASNGASFPRAATSAPSAIRAAFRATVSQPIACSSSAPKQLQAGRRPRARLATTTIVNMANSPTAPSAPMIAVASKSSAAATAHSDTMSRSVAAGATARGTPNCSRPLATPRNWQGALPFTYHVGGTASVRVHMHLEQDTKLRVIWDVVGTIEGADPAEKDNWVVAGNHRDAWVYGAVDPNSGTAAMLETVHGLGELLKQGWKPKRRIVIG